MNTLFIDDGTMEYNLNDKVTVHFNPTDANFLKKIYETMVSLQNKQEDNPEDIDAEKAFEYAEKRDAEMREIIDSVFDVPICNELFKGNVFARTQNGLPVWANLFLAIVDECERCGNVLNKKGNATVNKYIKKYHK